MKNVLLVAILLFSSKITLSQTDTIPKSAVLHGNNISAIVNSNGLLFHDIETGEGGFFHDDYPDIPLIKSAGLWFGGVDPGGNLKTSVLHPDANGRRDFIPGYFNKTTFEAKDFNYIASVTRLEIESHIQDFVANGVIDFPINSIFSWPGRDNPHFEAYTGMALPDEGPVGLASFYDENNDGIYDPMEGDYPTTGVTQNCFDPQLVPEQIIWTSAHDYALPHNLSNGEIVFVTVQTTAFAFDCTMNPLYSNTIGVAHKIIYKGDEDIDSVYFGVNVDFNLGCPIDDYIGVSPDNRTAYVYNAENTDEDCGEFIGLGANPPVVLCHFAKGPLDENLIELPPLEKAMVFSNGMNVSPPGKGFPNSSLDYYRYLSGSWKDGATLEFGGDGYQEATMPVNLPFTDNPNTVDGWSELTAGNLAGDRNFIGSTGNFTLQPGRINQVVIGFSVLQDNPFEKIYGTELSGELFEYYNSFCTFGDNCGQLPTNTNEEHSFENLEFQLYPNPTSNRLNLNFKSQVKVNSIKIFNLQGQELWLQENAKNINQIAVDWLPNGVYFLEAIFENHSVREKFIVVKN